GVTNGFAFLGADGVTPNDPGDGDTGPNNYQNFPVITAADSGGNVQGTFNSVPNTTFTLTFYASNSCNVAGADAQRVLGNTFVATDANGDATFADTLPLLPALGEFVTPTATDLSGRTSGLSPCA